MTHARFNPLFVGPMALGVPVFLAPMAGITDLPFRRAVTRFGAGLVVSEMVASTEMVTARPSSRASARATAMTGSGVPVSVQIAGREAGPMAETARIVAGMGAQIIDINMGCPAKKVTGGLSGAALMRDLDLAVRLIDAVIAAVDVPVTLKMRLGWDPECLNAADLAQRATGAGVAMLTVHGRTRAEFYRGTADWTAVGAVFSQLATAAGTGLTRNGMERQTSVPLVVNGDIVDASSARQAFSASGADAVMVGRGAQGRPWRLAEIAHDLFAAPAPDIPAGAALADFVTAHYEDIISFYGSDPGLRVARKHLGWYADAAGIQAKTPLLTAPTVSQTLRAIRDIFAAAPGA